MAIYLVIKNGESKDKIALNTGLTFGRSSSKVDVSIKDSKMSSRHLEIFYIDQKIIVKDLESTNGTYINNKKVEGTNQLFLYETIRVGNTLMTISLDELNPIEQKMLTKEVDIHDNEGTSTSLAGQTQFLTLNELKLDRPTSRNNLKEKAKVKPIKRIKKKVKEESTVMTKIFKKIIK